jgi:hypothetical protein
LARVANQKAPQVLKRRVKGIVLRKTENSRWSDPATCGFLRFTTPRAAYPDGRSFPRFRNCENVIEAAWKKTATAVTSVPPTRQSGRICSRRTASREQGAKSKRDCPRGREKRATREQRARRAAPRRGGAVRHRRQAQPVPAQASPSSPRRSCGTVQLCRIKCSRP